MLKIHQDADKLTILGDRFTVKFNHHNPDYFTVSFESFSQTFFIPACCDSATERDLNIGRGQVHFATSDTLCSMTFEYMSTLWRKIYHLDIYQDRLEFYYDLYGTNTIDTLRFFEGIESAHFIEQFYLTKHFNDNKMTPYRDYSKASPVGFKKVFNPEPNTYGKQIFEFFEYSQVSANCDLDYCGGNFIFNPGLLCFLVSSKPSREWISLGLGVQPGEHMFTEYEYFGGTEFGLNLNYWGHYEVKEEYRSPKVIITVGKTSSKTLDKYVSILISQGLNTWEQKPTRNWWHGPIICGWGHQCYKADLFRIRSPKERPKDSAAYLMCTQAHYKEFVDAIDRYDLNWKILIIDARWTVSAGTKEIDVGRWQDMRGFVEELHRRGKYVLAWWGMWDTEGLKPELCITYSEDELGKKINRPGRFAKFGNVSEGTKLSPDPTLPAFRSFITERIKFLLGNGANEINLDGFKIDHVAATPGLYGLKFPPGSQKLYGIELLKVYQKFIYDTAKSVKNDALIIGQSANPYFSDCTDMLRLGDLYSSRLSVMEQMIFRAEMARIANPYWLLDMDNWPLPNLKSMHDYMGIQAQYGVPSLYYSSHLDTTGEEITPEEFQYIRELWLQYEGEPPVIK